MRPEAERLLGQEAAGEVLVTDDGRLVRCRACRDAGLILQVGVDVNDGPGSVVTSRKPVPCPYCEAGRRVLVDEERRKVEACVHRWRFFSLAASGLDKRPTRAECWECQVTVDIAFALTWYADMAAAGAALAVDDPEPPTWKVGDTAHVVDWTNHPLRGQAGTVTEVRDGDVTLHTSTGYYRIRTSILERRP